MGHLFNLDKLDYVKNKKSFDGCILCAIREKSSNIISYELYRNQFIAVTLNLYPFNQGQLFVFPLRHITEYQEMTNDEAAALHCATVHALGILNKEFCPAGFNIGYNLGEGSGASIDHIHQHIVPRYPNELGFLELLSGTRVALHHPATVYDRLVKAFAGIN